MEKALEFIVQMSLALQVDDGIFSSAKCPIVNARGLRTIYLYYNLRLAPTITSRMLIL